LVAKNKRDREGLHKASTATACLLEALIREAKPDVTTWQLDEYAAAYIEQIGGEPVFRTQNKFPACINTSVNDEAVHGVPGDRVLEEGDLLKIDCGIKLDGYCGDATVTIAVGADEKLSPRRRAVMEAAREALRRGVEAVRVEGHAGDIGHAMQSYVESLGFRLLPQYTGHGLGRRLWEPPSIPAVGQPGTGTTIVDGLVFTIEPIVVGGSSRTRVGSDGWTVRTVDGAPAAQFEHTVMASKRGPLVLTQCNSDRLRPSTKD
jgi:methionyl aminopeptidase